MKQVRLHVGEAYIQELRTNAGTGYNWGYTVEGDEHAIEIERKLTPVAAGVAGGQVLELFVIHAAHAGVAVVNFALGRAWEGAPVQTETVKVTVHE